MSTDPDENEAKPPVSGRLQPLLIASIGVIGALAAGVLGHVLGLRAGRHELLEAARRDAYVDWTKVREEAYHAERLRSRGHTRADSVKADSIKLFFDVEGQKVLNRIALYGEKPVIDAFYSLFTQQINSQMEARRPPCWPLWREDAEIHHAMRRSLLGPEEDVSHGVLAFLVLRCDTLVAGSDTLSRPPSNPPR